ncbi:MAG: PilZ domain-containing protein [Candidatus Hydrogenedentes bacterium]|nr:PilZ domain-containing protein [Candidatus Hydrogenedentota bacterium]
MTNFEQEKRRLTRAAVDFTVRVTFEDGRVRWGALRNAGVKGIFVKVSEDNDAAIDARCEVHVGLDTAHSIDARGVVVRLEPEGFAIEFDSVDVDSLEDLHNIVIYNAEDPDQALEEVESARELGLELYYDPASHEEGAQ